MVAGRTLIALATATDGPPEYLHPLYARTTAKLTITLVLSLGAGGSAEEP